MSRKRPIKRLWNGVGMGNLDIQRSTRPINEIASSVASIGAAVMPGLTLNFRVYLHAVRLLAALHA